MSLVQNDHVVRQVSAHTSNPALGDAILQGTAKGGSDRFCAMLFDGRDDVGRELRIPVEDQEPMWLLVPQASRSYSTIHKAFGLRVRL